ncbi:MAG: sulfite exporter TauE/SafE family protein [Halobacteriota archaeon]
MELLGLSATFLALFVSFGFVVGLLYGFFGMGGSFLVTPVLLLLGYPAPVAIGSAMAFVFGTAVIATVKHHDIGQVDYKLGALMFVGLSVGIEGGRVLVFYLDDLGFADAIVGVTYVVILAGIGILFTKNALEDDEDDQDEAESHLEDADVDPDDIPDLAKKIQTYNIPPMVTLTGGIRVSLWTITFVALIVGIVSGFLGIGGGFIRLPAIYYLIGVPLPVAVGTNLFGGLISGAVGTFTYGQSGVVDLSIVAPLLLGSALGARIGSASTVIVDEDETRIYFGLLLLVSSVAVALGELSSYIDIESLDTVSVILIVGSAVLVVGAIVFSAIQAVRNRGTNVVSASD